MIWICRVFKYLSGYPMAYKATADTDGGAG